jgi:molybdopterin-guanine dinucleotide biosynthesis protein A
MYLDITGIILSGGKSSRMGQNKSFLKIGDKTIIDRVIDLMKSKFNEVIIITNEPELYQYTGLKLYGDIYKDVGPIAGIHSGLTHSNTEKNFIISCDIPLMNSDMIESIIKLSDNFEITVAKADGFIQQLCGVYYKSVLPLLEKSILADKMEETRDEHQTKRKCKVHSLLHSSNTNVIENIEELDGFFPDIFLNMNRIEDYEKIINLGIA